MWIVFSLFCMFALAAAEMVGKKAVDGDELAPLKLRISVIAVSFVIGMLMFAFGVGESGRAPWALLVEHPLILLAACFVVISDLLYLSSLRSIGMAIMETISSLEGVVIFIGLAAIYLVSGRLSAVQDMIVPARLILIVIILVFSFLLPYVETTASKKSAHENVLKEKRKGFIAGVLIAFAAVVFGAGDSLIADVVFDEGSVGVIDFAMTVYFASIVSLPVLLAIFIKKRKSSKAPPQVQGMSRYAVLYCVLCVGSLFLGALATSIDPVRSEVMYLMYPVISIVGAMVFLKERYTWKQNLCIWVITLSAIAFCVVDYIV